MYSVFLSSYKNKSGRLSLGEREMLWEQQPISARAFLGLFSKLW